jgi:hypothetical protein
VDEVEVPRVGTRLSVAFNHAHWRDGRVVVWLGVRRATGRGEASSGLAAPRGPVWGLLDLTGLIGVFSVHASVDEAVRAAGGSRLAVTAG